MSKRLLTDEGIKKFKAEARGHANDLQNSNEGNFKQEDIGAIFHDADKAMLEAQAKLTKEDTLKAVGDWLGDIRFCSSMYNSRPDVLLDGIDALKNGEMPGDKTEPKKGGEPK